VTIHADPERPRNPISVRPRLPKASNVLANELRRRVLLERLPVGAELPNEAQMIASSGFSRATVREALRLLESDGLVTIKRGPRGGVTVAHPDTGHVTRSLALMLALSDAPVRDLFAYRMTLEPAAAAMAAASATDDQRAALLDIARPDPGREVAHNVDFHLLLAEATNNEFFRVSLNAVHEITEWHSTDEGLAGSDLQAAVTAHRRIAEHISVGNASGAERAMRKHISVFESIMDDHGRLDTPIIHRSGLSSWT
jgi:GntR family transcriptional repressor for pyruvate dehydrogenase complex